MVKVLAAVAALLLVPGLSGISPAQTRNLAVCKRPLKSAGGPAIVCRGPVHPKLTDFVFEFGDKLKVRRAGRKPVLQTLTSPLWAQSGPPMILRDINFDGYADIHIIAKANYGCEYHYFWLFDASKGRFGKVLDESNLAIGGLGCGWIKVHAKRKEISNEIIPRGTSTRVTRVYTWRRRKLELKRVIVRVYSRTGKCRERHYRAAHGKPVGAGYKSCPRDAEVGVDPGTPGDRDLRRRKTFDAWIR